MVLLVIAVAATLVAQTVPLELAPSIVAQGLTVDVSWPNASPESVETEVVSTIEQAAATLRGVASVSSLSRRGSGQVSVNLEDHVDLDAVRFALKDRLRSFDLPPRASLIVRAGLPFGSFDSYRTDHIGMLLAGASGSSGVPFRVRLSSLDSDWLEEVDRLEVRNTFLAAEGVSDVLVSGGVTQIVQVTFDPEHLVRLGTSPSDVVLTLAPFGLDTRQIGVVAEHGLRAPVYLAEPGVRPADVGKLEIGGGSMPWGVSAATARRLTIADVADVCLVSEPPEDRGRVDGAPAVLVDVTKKEEANLVGFSAVMRQTVAALSAAHGDRLRVEILVDEGAEVQALLADLGLRLAGSMVAVLLALIVFFRQIRPTVIVYVALLLTLVMAVAILALLKVPLSMVTMAAIVLAAGMLVDNSLVIYEHLVGAQTLPELADRAASILPVIATSSLTNVVVFAPFLFFTGSLRALLAPFATTMLAAMASSVVVSILAVPFLQWYVVGLGRRSTANVARLNILPVLRRRRLVVPVVAAVALYLLVVLLPNLWERQSYSPSTSPDSVSVSIGMLSDARVEETDDIATDFEALALESIARLSTTDRLQVITDVHRTRAAVRVTPRRIGGSVLDLDSVARQALVDIEQQWLRQTGNYVSVGLSVYGPSGHQGTGGIGEDFRRSGGSEVEFSGYDYNLLKEHAIAFSHHMERIPYLYPVDNGFEREERVLFGPSFPGFDLHIDSNAAAKAGVESSHIVRALEPFLLEGRVVSIGSIEPEPSSTPNERGSDSTVRVEIAPIADTAFFRIEEILSIPLNTAVSIGDVAHIEPLDSAQTINRENQRYVHTVSYKVRPQGAMEARSALTSLIEAYPFPAGFSAILPGYGMWSEGDEQRDTLGLAVLAAVVLVYMVLAGHFESLLRPLLVFISIPLAVVVVVAWLSVTGGGLGIGGLLGMVLLAGIAVNDAILFVAEARRYERPAQRHDAGRWSRTNRSDPGKRPSWAATARSVIRTVSSAPDTRRGRVAAIAVRRRLRPILVTTFTTVMALIPSLFGTASNDPLITVWREFAFVVVLGISASTAATVFVLPAVYTVRSVQRPTRGRVSRS